MSQAVLLPMEKIEANINQPRLSFEESDLNELASSIKENGLIQPIVVRKVGDIYQIIAGERRYRACKLLGYHSIQCFLVDKDDLQSAEMALVENIQRQNLSAIEEAKAYIKIIEKTKISQVDLAKKMGKSQSAIANKIRLLMLPEEVQNKVVDKTITERHARALLNVHEDHVSDVMHTIIEKKMNVTQSEEYIDKYSKKEKKQAKPVTKGYSKNIQIGINTIEQAIAMCKKAGLEVDYEKVESASDVKVIVKFMKEGN